jgi:hypothetical protein
MRLVSLEPGHVGIAARSSCAVESPPAGRALPTGRRHLQSKRWRLTAAVAICFVIVEVIDLFSVHSPAAALMTATLFIAAAVLTARGRLAGPIIVGLLCVLEVAFVPAYPRSSTYDWVVQVVVVVLGASGIGAVTAALLERRRVRESVA